jgi:hypothetical protein
MACIFSEGWDSYGATADLVKKWTANAAPTTFTWSSTAGRWGGGALVMTNQPSQSSLQTWQTFNTYKIAWGFWILVNQKPTSTSFLISFQNIAHSWCVSSYIFAPTGQLGIGDNGGTTATPVGGPNICDGNWHWVEYGTTLQAGGTGPVAFYVDGAQVWSGGTNTSYGGNGPIVEAYVMNPIGCQAIIDDFMVYDDATGLRYSTAFPLGPRRIATTRPAADSGIVQFVPSTGGVHNVLVNEVNPTAANGYVSDATSGHKEIYGYGPLGFAPTSISTVMLNSALENPGGGVINYRTICLSGATESDSVSTVTPLNLRVMQQGYDTDPNTGVAWTYTNLNNANFGVMVT